MSAETQGNWRVGWSLIGKTIGVGLFLLIVLVEGPADLPPAARRLAAVTALMAALWLTQAIPIAATSLIPLAAFPLLGIQTADEVSSSYIDKNIFLFLGGFIIALGIEKWNLHRRMALHIVRVLGTSLRLVVLGFMLATAFLSMWISNTASTLLMLPIGLAMIASLRDVVGAADQASRRRKPPGANAGGDACDASENPEAYASGSPGMSGASDASENPEAGASRASGTSESSENPEAYASGSPASQEALGRLGVVLMLGIAYAASIGGLTTLVGTPTNVAFVGIWSRQFADAPAPAAGAWIVAVVPLGIVLLLAAWGVLVWRLPRFPGGERLQRSFFTERLRALGPMSRPEMLMLAVFAATAALWVFRKPLQFGEFTLPFAWGPAFERFLTETLGVERALAGKTVHDSTVAMAMAVLMFFIPAGRDDSGRARYLMDWRTAERLPWGILLLIGGGFAIAGAFAETGLSRWIGDRFAETVAGWPVVLTIAGICLLMTFLTELTSNVATVSTLLPILAAVSRNLQIDPRLIMIPATISASCAFMLPIATPPNAIIFGSGKVRMGQMARYGIALNLLGVVLVTAAMLLSIMPQFGISLGEFPAWAAERR